MAKVKRDKPLKAILVFSCCVLYLSGGCAKDKPRFTQVELDLMPLPQKAGLPEVSGGFVLGVGGENITAAEVVTPALEHFREFARSTDF